MINVELLLLSYAGIFIHYLVKLWEASKKEQLSVFFSKNSLIKDGIGAAVSIVCCTLLVYVHQYITDFIVLTPLLSAIMGYNGQKIFIKIVAAKMPAMLNDDQMTDEKNLPAEEPKPTAGEAVTTQGADAPPPPADYPGTRPGDRG